MQKVSVGRIVHFFPAKHDGQCRANNAEMLPAIVVSVGDVESGSCNLRVFQDGANVPWRTSVMHKSKAQKGQHYWEWPQKEAAKDEQKPQEPVKPKEEPKKEEPKKEEPKKEEQKSDKDKK